MYSSTLAVSVILAGTGAVAFFGTISVLVVPALSTTEAPVTLLDALNSNSFLSLSNIAIKLALLFQLFRVANLA